MSSSISQKIRNTRYRVQNNALSLSIRTAEHTYHLQITDVSIRGIGACFDPSDVSTSWVFTPGDILPQASVTAVRDGTEFQLGRILPRFVDASSQRIGFFVIDDPLPVDGQLSQYLAHGSNTILNGNAVELDPTQFDLKSFAAIDEGSRDIFTRCAHFQAFYAQWKRSPLYLYYTVRRPSKGTRVELALKRRGQRQDFIQMCSNDYLGMAAHPKVIEAGKRALDTYGVGPTGSPSVSGLTEAHEALADYLARQFRKEKVLLFCSGYSANVGSFPSLTQPSDLLLVDFFCHASIQDGLRLSPATHRFFKHNDMAHLEKLLREQRDKFSGCMIITEGVFSMDGDTCPLDEIVALAQRYDARVFVDEAHSYGLLGPHGGGIADEYYLTESVDLFMGTFSKICGGHGGFIAGDAAVLDWIECYGTSYTFSAALPPASAAAALAAIKLVFEEEPERLQRLRANIQHFVRGLQSLGYLHLDESHQSAIVPVIIGDEQVLSCLTAHLVEHGVMVVPMVYPAVARNRCRFRFTISSEHTISDLDYTLQVLSGGMRKANYRFSLPS